MELLQWITKFITTLGNSKSSSINTVVAYRTDLLQFYDFCKQKQVNDANIDVVREWVVSLKMSGVSSKSINRKIIALRSFYRFLMSESVVDDNVAKHIRLLKTDTKLPSFISMKDMEAVLSSDIFDDSFEGVRNRFVMEFLYDTGIRLHELIMLDNGSIDTENCTIKVFGKRSKERIIPFPKTLVKSYNTYISKRSEVIYASGNTCDRLIVTNDGRPCSPSMIQRMVKKVLFRCTNVFNGSPHTIRHTYATHLINNGTKIQVIKELLGHSTLASTQIYAHNDIEQLKKVYSRCHPHS